MLNYGGSDGGFLRSREEMVPTETGANYKEKNSPPSSAVKNLSPRGGWPPTEPGGRIGTKIVGAATAAAPQNPSTAARTWRP